MKNFINENPFFSVCMCIYKGDKILLQNALQSIVEQSFMNYEIIIVLDGDTHIYDDIFNKFKNKIKLIRQQRKGISYSRNNSILNSCGKIITFLDCDNTYNPKYLQTLYDNYKNNPNVNCIYCALQYISNSSILFKNFDRNTLLKNNFIDMNIFSFHKELFNKYGGFDEKLSRLVDWDLVLNYTKYEIPLAINYVAVNYNDSDNRYRITLNENYNYNYYYITHKYTVLQKKNLKILYYVHHYCQLSETYIDWEINYFLSLGFEIRIVINCQILASPVKHEKILYTDFPSAFNDFSPDLVHVHWIHLYNGIKNYLTKNNIRIPISIRIHGFEYNSSLNNINSDPNVKLIMSYPHIPNVTKSKNMRIPIYPSIHYPPPIHEYKEKILVTRLGACLPTKDLKLFIDIAYEIKQKSNNFKFKASLVLCYTMEYYYHEIVEYNNSKNKPCEIMCNNSREESANLLRKSKIYLHTIGNEKPYGQPISIAEAMACGNYIIAKELGNSTKEYINDCGVIYKTKEEAITELLKTETWCEDQWKNVYNKSINYAYNNFVPENIYEPFLEMIDTIKK
jgi:glycosyltransferase involved in cell wall biosynthesis